MRWVSFWIKDKLRAMVQPLLVRLARQLRPLLAEEFTRQPLPSPAATSTAPDTPPAIVSAPTIPYPSDDPDAASRFRLRVIETARSVASSGDHRVILPTDTVRLNRSPRIGYFGNIANNSYNFVASLRRLGHDVELVIEDGWFDTFVMNRPFWEDVEVECGSYDEALTHEPRWVQPKQVRRVAYDAELQQKYQGRYSAVAEVQSLYQATFGVKLAADRALLLAQQMGHWPYLQTMKRYDLVQFSGSAIMMGPFCPVPYVVFPTGSDLFISPFEETDFGLLMRAGYRGAAHIVTAATNLRGYLDRLGTRAPNTFLPMLIDTDRYPAGDGGPLRTRWEQETGGSHFILGVCRQAWQWKGNDRLIHAFKTWIERGNSSWRLVLMAWGPDVEKSKALIAECGIERFVRWEPFCSKPTLRLRQQAADVVVDQVVMEGYGTSVVESMAAGTPIIVAPLPETSLGAYRDPPPFLPATSAAEIVAALGRLSDDAFRAEQGQTTREWVVRTHGYMELAPRYWNIYRSLRNGVAAQAA